MRERTLPSSSGRPLPSPTRLVASLSPTRSHTTRWPRRSRAGRGVEHRAAAEGQHARVRAQRLDHGGALEQPEPVLALVDEDLRDLLAGGRLDVVVGVADLDAPPGREQPADGGLAGPHRPDQHHARGDGLGCGHEYLSDER